MSDFWAPASRRLAESSNWASRRSLSILNLALSAMLVWATCNTDRTFDRVRQLVKEESVNRARAEFDNALDEAEKHYSDGSCAPAYLIEVPLDKATSNEPVAAERLTAAEYNRLAMLGSFIWDFERTESYTNKAKLKSATATDRFFSYMVLAHIHFRHMLDDPEHASLKEARRYFRLAIGSLQESTAGDAAQFQLGQGYGLWASHEAFLKNADESRQLGAFAEASWGKLAARSSFIRDLDDRLSIARNGTMPGIAGLFKPQLPICGAVPTRESLVGPETETTPSLVRSPVPTTPAPKREPTLAPQPRPTDWQAIPTPKVAPTPDAASVPTAAPATKVPKVPPAPKAPKAAAAKFRYVPASSAEVPVHYLPLRSS